VFTFAAVATKLTVDAPESTVSEAGTETALGLRILIQHYLAVCRTARDDGSWRTY